MTNNWRWREYLLSFYLAVRGMLSVLWPVHTSQLLVHTYSKFFFSYHTVNTSCKPKEMKTEPPAYIYIQRQQHSLQFL
jgi:hypothetical protein